MVKIQFNIIKSNSLLKSITDIETCLGEIDSNFTSFESDAIAAKGNLSHYYGVSSYYDQQDTGEKDASGKPILESVKYYKSKHRNNDDELTGVKHSTSSQAVSDAISKKVGDDKETYQGYLNTLKDSLFGDSGSITKIDKKIEKLKILINGVSAAIEKFEGHTPSLKETLETLNVNLTDLSANLEYGMDLDGTEVIYYVDPSNGKKYTIAEMTNAFYTYTGSAVQGAVAADLVCASNIDGWDSMTSEQQSEARDKLINNYVSGIGDNVYQLLGRGFMSVASDSDIEALKLDPVYANAATDYDSIMKAARENLSEDEIANLLSSGTNSFLAGGCTMAALAAYLKTDILTAEPAEGETGLQTKNEEAVEEEEKEEQQTENGTTGDWSDEIGDGGPSGSGGGGGGGTDGGGSGGGAEDTTPPAEELPPIEEVNDEVKIDEIDKEFDETTTEEIKEEIQETHEDFIDEQARDQFYDETKENVEIREQIDEKVGDFEQKFENSTDTKEITDALEEVGYSKEDAAKIAAEGDVIVASNAYRVGLQDQEMAKIAKELAEDAGVKDFDTGYDDPQSYNTLKDGTVNVELTDHENFVASLDTRVEDGLINKEVAESITKEFNDYEAAEKTYVEAKTAYEEKYTKTDAAINEAQKAQQELDTYLKALKQKSGEDSTKWTEAEITELNKLTKNYNTKVIDANKLHDEYMEQYKTYKNARTELTTQKNEYYDELLEYYRDVQGINPNSNINDNANIGNNLNTPQVPETNFKDDNQSILDSLTSNNGEIGSVNSKDKVDFGNVDLPDNSDNSSNLNSDWAFTSRDSVKLQGEK